MGNLFGGGQSKSDTVTNQSYSADPAVEAAGQTAISKATQAANQPFQQPVAPVAGFSPLQQQAFNQYQALQNSAQPYYNQANQYITQGGANVTGEDVNKYYNPMSSGVFAAMANAQGQESRRAMASAAARAGGFGADRLAVTQGNLDQAHELATGATAANLWTQALQAAQADRQRMIGAGQGLGQLGAQNFATNLQGTGALYGAGQAQQQQQQAELNAPYQNTLARIAYQFQTPQYLAGITGGLSPAMNHSQYGTSQTTNTPAQPSIFSQLAGLGMAGAGLAMGFPGLGAGIGSMFGGGGEAYGGNGVYGGSSSNPLPGLSASDYGEGYADGGGIDGEMDIPGITGDGNTSPIPHMDDGGLIGPGFMGSDLKTQPNQSMWDFLKSHPIPGFGGSSAQAAPVSAQPAYPMADPMNSSGYNSVVPAPMRVAVPAARAKPLEIQHAQAPEADNGLSITKLPYPNATEQNWGQKLSRSPWMSLVQAGATMASTPGGIGTSLGKGLLAGAKGMEEQNKQSNSDEEINNRARALYQQAQQHLDQYNKMTPYQRQTLALKNKELDQESGGAGTDVAGRALHARALQYYKLLKGDVNNMNKPDAEIQAKAYEMAKGAGGGGAPASGPQPDPGPGKRVKGQIYIGPDGLPRPWEGP